MLYNPAVLANLDEEVGSDQQHYDRQTGHIRPILDPGTKIRFKLDLSRSELKDLKDGPGVFTRINVSIYEGTHAGKRLLPQYVSTKRDPWREGSSLEDLLRACGHKIPPANGTRYTKQEILDALQAIDGAVFLGKVDWMGDCSQCYHKIWKSNEFPIDENGNRVHVIPCPTPECEGRLIGATLRIVRYLEE